MFIVLEGIDGAGKGRQRKELAVMLETFVNKLHSQEFPDHLGPIYEHLIHPALHEEIKLNKNSWFLSFALDQSLRMDAINSSKKSKNEFYLADGYFTTNIVYQTLVYKNFTMEETLQFAKVFGITEPDLTIFIDVDPNVAMERKMAEDGHDEGLDINERDIAKQSLIRAGYKQMVNEQIFGRWVEVNGNGSIIEVRDQIFDVIKKANLI